MTMITLSRELVQQVLEALEADNSKLWPSDKRTAAYFNLRSAMLQQPVEPVATLTAKMDAFMAKVHANPRYEVENVAASVSAALDAARARRHQGGGGGEMTRDDIIRMAREAGLTLRGHYDEPGSTPQELERFAALVAAAGFGTYKHNHTKSAPCKPMTITHAKRPNKVVPIEPTRDMIVAGAQRLLHWEPGSEWPDSWSAAQATAARNDAERVWRSMWEAASEDEHPNPPTTPTPEAAHEMGAKGGPASDEAWDQGHLGRERAHARRVAVTSEQVAQADDALDLQMISIRLPRALIEELKMIGRLHGLGYQPLVRQTLTRFAHSELKRFARERIQAGEEEAEVAARRVA